MGFSGDFKPRREELGFDFAKDGAMGKRKPCPGSKWRWDLEQLFPVYFFSSAMKKHSTHGSLWSWGKEKIHFVSFWKWRGPMTRYGSSALSPVLV
jgi:hypothetical protein